MTIDFRKRGINIDSTFRCTLQCPSCMRADYKRKGRKIPGVDMPWEAGSGRTPPAPTHTKDTFKSQTLLGPFS